MLQNKMKMFYVTYAVWMFANIMTVQSNLGGYGVYNIIKNLAYIVFFFIFISTNKAFTARQFFKLFVVAIIGIVLYVYSNSQYLISLWFVILACKYVDYDKLIRIDFKVRLLASGLIIFLNFLGMIPSSDGIKEGVIRYSLGFNHVNAFSLTMFVLLCEYFYIHYRDMNLKRYVIIAMWIIWVFTIARSSTFLLMSVTGIFVFSIRSHNTKKNTYKNIKTYALILIALIVFSWAISLFFMFFYDSSSQWMVALNKAFSGRFKLLNNGYRQFGLELFGQEINWITTSLANSENALNVVDNGLGRLLLTQGIIPSSILILGIISTLIYSYKKEKYKVCFAMFMMLFYGIAESGCYYVMTNPFLIFAAQSIYGFSAKNSKRRSD